jgi:hypothetical protein
MTSPTTECNAKTYVFGQQNRRQIVADFSGGTMTQDGGVLLVSRIDQHLELSQRLAECFSDQRDEQRVQHQLPDLLAQRLYGLVQGYEDLNDHDGLRHDVMFQVALGQLESQHARCAPLAGKSTLNRLEQAMVVPFDLSGERYHKFTVNPSAVEALLVDLFIEQMERLPKRLILDLDVTNDPVHGEQVSAYFNGYYEEVCYAPLLIFCGRHLLSAKLRPSNVDPAAEALPELQRIIGQIRQVWPQVEIVVRGDSAYSRDDIMRWCEAQTGVSYVLAHASNARLRTLTWHLEQKAKAAYEQTRDSVATALKTSLGDTPEALSDLDALVPPQVFYQSVQYRTEKSWSRCRRLVCKLTDDAQGARRHWVVTSWTADEIPPAKLHTDFYCPRGEMENRIKEHQLDLFSDRTSCHEFEANQLRLWFSSFAYVLMQALRQTLAQTPLADAQCGTIRRQLLKVTVRIRLSVRRIHLAFNSGWAGQHLFDQVYQSLFRWAATG